MGSVKDLQVLRGPDEATPGEGIFIFSDRYSVFDWGEMPDHIPLKGAALCLMAAYNFEMLARSGIPTHYLGLLDSQGNATSLSELARREESSAAMRVKLARVLPIDENYKEYLNTRNNYLLPLEIIYRNGAPKGSSILRKPRPAALRHDGDVQEGTWFDWPLYSFTTKLEQEDRPLSYEEAYRISGLDGKLFGQVFGLAQAVNEHLTEHAQRNGLEHWDGKIECAKTTNGLMVVDVCGTPDEARLCHKGLTLSKEILREHYKKEQPEWHADIQHAKKEARRQGIADWKSLCTIEPRPLPEPFKILASDLYAALANHWIGKNMLDAPSLSNVIDKIERWT